MCVRERESEYMIVSFREGERSQDVQARVLSRAGVSMVIFSFWSLAHAVEHSFSTFSFFQPYFVFLKL